MNALEDVIADDWGWKIRPPVTVIATNSFGNVILRDASGSFYRIIPEDLVCDFLTNDENRLIEIRNSKEFQTDWEMARLVRAAEEAHGALLAGQCYHLVIPSVLGGAYSPDNIRRVSITDWLGAAGSLAKQLEGVPDGAHGRLKTK